MPVDELSKFILSIAVLETTNTKKLMTAATKESPFYVETWKGDIIL